MDQAQVHEIVFSILGSRPLKVNEMTYGEMNTVYEVVLPDRELIFRANELRQALDGTERNIEILSQLGIPVPNVIYADVSQDKYPFSFILLDKIAGKDLRFVFADMSNEELSRLAQKIVEIQQKVSTLPLGTGYGFAAIHKKANAQTWQEYIEWDIHYGLPHIKSIIGEKGTKAINKELYLLRSYFEQVKPVCFLDDITIKNVMVHDGEFQGIIDLDWVCYGDPLSMIGLTQASIHADICNDSVFYIEALCHYWGITREQRKIIDFYSLIHSMNLIRIRRNHRLFDAVQRLEKSIEKWVNNLSSSFEKN